MSVAGEWSLAIREGRERVAAMKIQSGWGPPKKAIGEIAHNGDLIVRTALLNPSDAVNFAKWILATFDEPQEADEH